MKPINVAILHHHLRGGGVTRVIERCVEALAPYPVSVCIIVGEEGALNYENIGVVDGLSYGENIPKRDLAEIKKEVIEKAENLLKGSVDIWHIHNHSLGKNAMYTELARTLVQDGEKVLLQIHDFAEDNRPENYQLLKNSVINGDTSLVNDLYPVATHVKYAVLNARDEGILIGSGIPEQQVQILSNPVVMDATSRKSESVSIYVDETKLLIYPVRAIPRKNIGETVLWAAISDSKDHFGITLAPKNPKYREFYESWVSFCETYQLSVTFEPGKKWGLSFEELLENADGIITTSMQEGFGLAFLENWLIEKPLYGRLLEDITKDFIDEGIEYPGMYTHLPIPLYWLDKDDVQIELSKGIKEVLSQYDRFSKSKTEEWIEALIKDGVVDFGILSQALQQKVIKKILDNPELKKELPVLISNTSDEEVLPKNKKIVEKKFNLENYGKKLISIYSDLIDSGTENVEYADSSKVLSQFLSPKQFTLLRA